MSEAKFVEEIICEFTAIDSDIHISEVESHISSPGIPDLDVCSQGKEIHLEIKHSDNGVMPSIRPTQKKWFNRRVAAGGKPWVLARILDKKTKQWLTMLIPGHLIQLIVQSSSVDSWVKASDLVYSEDEMEIGGWFSILNHITS